MAARQAPAPHKPHDHSAQLAHRVRLVGKTAIIADDAPALIEDVKHGALPKTNPEVRPDAVAPELRAKQLHKLAGRLAL